MTGYTHIARSEFVWIHERDERWRDEDLLYAKDMTIARFGPRTVTTRLLSDATLEILQQATACILAADLNGAGDCMFEVCKTSSDLSHELVHGATVATTKQIAKFKDSFQDLFRSDVDLTYLRIAEAVKPTIPIAMVKGLMEDSAESMLITKAGWESINPTDRVNQIVGRLRLFAALSISTVQLMLNNPSQDDATRFLIGVIKETLQYVRVTETHA